MAPGRYQTLNLAYYPRHNMSLRDLPENHLKRCKEVPFEFEEYRVSITAFRPTTSSLACPTNALSLSASITTESKVHTKCLNVSRWPCTSTNACQSINTSPPWRNGTPSISLRVSTAGADTIWPTLASDYGWNQTIYTWLFQYWKFAVDILSKVYISWTVLKCCRSWARCSPPRLLSPMSRGF